jgi:DNA processing protein
MDNTHVAGLALSECNLSFNQLQRLIDSCGSTIGVLEAPNPVLLKRLSVEQQKLLQGYARAWRNDNLAQQLQPHLDWLQQHQTQLLLRTDQAYPQLLRQLDEAPPLLFVQGNTAVLNDPQVAMVGSRLPSTSGLRLAQEFAARLATFGITVTSGLALGIDGASHRGCLAAGGQTIAVLGSGLRHIYPRKHLGLAANIIAQGGALVSSWPLTAKPLPYRFPARNRIISGLSLGVLVVEAAQKSGSLITARAAVQKNREVFALPSSVRNHNAAGCHQLIRDGALLVDQAEQILAELAPQLQNLRLPQDKTEPLQELTNSNAAAKGLTPELAQLLNNFGHDALTVDIIAAQTGLSFAQLSVQLIELELLGLVRHSTIGYERIY